MLMKRWSANPWYGMHTYSSHVFSAFLLSLLVRRSVDINFFSSFSAIFMNTINNMTIDVTQYLIADLNSPSNLASPVAVGTFSVEEEPSKAS